MTETIKQMGNGIDKLEKRKGNEKIQKDVVIRDGNQDANEINREERKENKSGEEEREKKFERENE